MSEYEGITTPDPDAEVATSKAQRELEDELHSSSIFGKFPALVIDPNGRQRNLDMNPGRTWLYPDAGIAVTIPEEAVVLSEPNTRPWNKSQPGHISDQSGPPLTATIPTLIWSSPSRATTMTTTSGMEARDEPSLQAWKAFPKWRLRAQCC